jgi:hypothetical protein
MKTFHSRLTVESFLLLQSPNVVSSEAWATDIQSKLGLAGLGIGPEGSGQTQTRLALGDYETFPSSQLPTPWNAPIRLEGTETPSMQ